MDGEFSKTTWVLSVRAASNCSTVALKWFSSVVWKEDYDQAVEGEEQILSLLSSEFEQVFSKAIRERMIRIKFMENRGGTLKIHSTISKKARGAMVTAMMKEEITHLEDLKSLEVAGFSYREDLSQEKEWIFVKE